MERKVTLFSSAKNNYQTKSWSLEISNVAQIISHAEDSQLKDRIAQCRELYLSDKEEYKRVKLTLPCITFCGVFSERRRENLLHYSNYVCLDFDHFPSEDTMIASKQMFMHLPFVSMVFASPSGYGLKVVVRHDNNDPSLHEELFNQLKEYPCFLLMEFDNSVKDIARACFLSYDPLMYYNPDATAFHFDAVKARERMKAIPQRTMTIKKKTASPNRLMTSVGDLSLLDGHTDSQIINFLNNHFWKRHPEDYTDGHRHESLLKKAGLLCAYGVSYDAALQEMVYRYTYHGLDEGDITRAVSSAYSRIEFGNKRTELVSMMDYRGTISAETIEMMYNYKNIIK